MILRMGETHVGLDSATRSGWKSGIPSRDGMRDEGKLRRTAYGSRSW
jgi:hypothetical protein